MRLRDRLQEISIAENINAYCHRFAMQKKCTAYTKSQKKPFCCKINQNNIHDFHSIHQMVILQPNEIPARSLNTFESETRLNNVFFTYLFLKINSIINDSSKYFAFNLLSLKNQLGFKCFECSKHLKLLYD